MRLQTIILSFVCCVPFLLFAQPKIKWQRCLGGTNRDVAYACIPTFDGGFLLAGSTESTDGDVQRSFPDKLRDGWLIKVDSLWYIEWQRSLEDTVVGEFFAVVQTPDSNYAVAGSAYTKKYSSRSNRDIYVAKLDRSGNIIWKGYYGGTLEDRAFDIKGTPDSGFVIVGSTESNYCDVWGNHGKTDGWVFKLSASGKIEWQRCIGGSDGEQILKVLVKDGGYVLLGYTSSTDGDIVGNHGDYDILLAELTDSGTIKSSRCYGTAVRDYGGSIVEDENSEYVIVGSTVAFIGDSLYEVRGADICLFRIDSNGSIRDQRILGGTKNDYGVDLMKSTNGYVLLAHTESSDLDVDTNYGEADAWLVGLDGQLSIAWQKVVGGTQRDAANAIIPTRRGFAIAGETYSSKYLGYSGEGDAWMVELSAPTGKVVVPSNSKFLLRTNPNPVRRNTTLTLLLQSASSRVVITITNVNGERIYEIHMNGVVQGEHEIPFAMSSFPHGTYFVTVTADGIFETTVVQVVK